MCDLKAAQINMQRCLIQKFMLCEFELGPPKHQKTFIMRKREGVVDYNTVSPTDRVRFSEFPYIKSIVFMSFSLVNH